MKIKTFSWIAQVIVVVILGQTLFFKFTDHPDTVAIFEQLGMGAFGYKTIGILELVACILLLIPGSIAFGAILAWGLMTGAIIAHITEIGFAGPEGQLGFLAITAWSLSLFIIYARRARVPLIRSVFKAKPKVK